MDEEDYLLKLTEWFLDNGKGGVAVAFSGGVDSTLVAAVAKNVLGNKALAVTVNMEFLVSKEIREAEQVAARLGIKQKIVNLRLTESIKRNPPDRCYQCKKLLLKKIKETAAELLKRKNLRLTAIGPFEGKDFFKGIL